MSKTNENGKLADSYLTKQSLFHQIRNNGIIIITLLLLSCLGIGITDFSPHYGVRYWIIITAVFALISIFFGFSKNKELGYGTKYVFTQILHWLGLLLAIFMILYLEGSGRINSEAAGLVTLLIVAVVSFLSGVHGDWRFGLIGILLGLTLIGAAWIEEYFWMLLIPLFIALVIGILWFWHQRKTKSSVESR
ncbi:MAG TPA: hypothetical protein VKN82_03960 [Desulfohalobiaceae bacterium]|nr:hypothetical protein [Desulfohalobiaceae bacterium]